MSRAREFHLKYAEMAPGHGCSRSWAEPLVVIEKSAFDKAIEALRFIEQDRNLNERPHLVARRVLVELGCFDLKQTSKED